jgi:hypothetical protein
MTRLSALLFSLVFVCSCSGDKVAAPIPAVDHDAQGSWRENTGGVLTPGSSFIITMTESSGAVAGVGSFTGEAGPFGTLVVSGTVANDSLHLQIVYLFDPHVFPSLQPDTARFAAVLTNRDRIDGELTRGGTSSPFGLLRLMIDDPG